MFCTVQKPAQPVATTQEPVVTGLQPVFERLVRTGCQLATEPIWTGPKQSSPGCPILGGGCNQLQSWLPALRAKKPDWTRPLNTSWVLDGEHALKKKGVGRGIHLSGVICVTQGYLIEAGQTLEYGKNYEGYLTGELFVKQVSFEICFVNVHSRAADCQQNHTCLRASSRTRIPSPYRR
jgi:hypothetical protein